MKPARSHVPALAAVVGFTAALFPLAIWYVRRMGDGSDEPLGLLALAFALAAAWSSRESLAASPAGRTLGDRDQQ